MILQGKRVRLRATERDDLPLAVQYLNDPEVLMWFGQPAPLGMDDEIAWYERMRQDDGVINFAIEVEGRYVGGCGLTGINHVHRRAEIGIFVGDKSIWGRGVGSEAMALVMGYGFDYLNLHRIFLRVFAENTRAIHVYESLGFQHEGRFRDTEWRHGRWHDMLYMSVLETEWRQRSDGKAAS
ncbi:MAG: GNAT family N-acetyltransferase [Anaerolineae bacterium]|nr:GNAT family N-acetyltransferase [Anaerolineae bacterium]